MLIDIVQNKDNVSVSYVNENNKIDIINIPLKYGYYKYVSAEEFEKDNINIVKNLRSFKRNSLIKREPDRYFSKHNLNEFINYEVKEEFPEIYEKISSLNIPLPFSVDIETDITDEFGYSDQYKTENRILSITITDFNLNSLIFVLKNPEQPNFTDFENIQIKDYINQALGDAYKNKYEYNFQIKVFETEFEMLNAFLDCVNKYFQSIIGWNFLGYDWLYIMNRCKLLGIPISKASPINKISKNRFEVSNAETINLEIPTHRIIGDYMLMFKDSLIYNNLESYSLNNCAEHVLNLKKVMYEGNLRKLYQEEYLKFIAYALIDTILVMLIHRATNLYSVDFFEAYYNKIFYSKISQNSISEALVYNNLREENLFFLEEEFNKPVKREYLGGYVKNPTKKIVNSMIGIDFSGLYPNSIITCGISPERKVDSIVVENGKPATLVDEIKWNKYKTDGNYILTPTGRIYDNTTDGIFIKIEKKLINERAIFKGHKNDLYLKLIPKLEELIKQKEQLNS